MKKNCKNRLIWLIVNLVFFLALAGQAWANPTEPCTIMHPDHETLMKWIDDYDNAQAANIDPEVDVPSEGAFDLLSHFQYTPSERNQGSCGNCWVWAGTGVMEVALDVENSILDRLSIQYLNSCYSGSYACCGGNLSDFTSYYSGTGKTIPWSNTNASYQDASRTCANGSSGVSCASIVTTPDYPVTSISAQSITTQGVAQATAISNIKNVLHQNKAVWFAFYLPTAGDWNNFRTFWNGSGENVIWNPDFSCGHTWVNGEGGGHAVLCVGYNDDDPNNRYWIIVNSWGTAGGGRPNGIFRLDMDMNYSCQFNYYGSPNYSFEFQTLDIDFNVADICECDLNHDGNCDMADWLMFGEDWGRTDCPVVTARAQIKTSVAANSNESGNPDEIPFTGDTVFGSRILDNIPSDGFDDDVGLPAIKEGTSVPGGDIGDTPETAGFSGEPIWQALQALDLSEKQNCLLQLEGSGNLDSNTAKNLKKIESMWNSENFAGAVNKLKSLETDGLTLSAGLSWKTPKQVESPEWTSDVRVGTKKDIKETHLDFDAETGNLFAVLRYMDTISGRYYWSVNISTDNGQSWQETYTWYATYEIKDTGASVVGNYLFVGYVGGITFDEGRIRRFTVSNGIVDGTYGYKTVFDKDIAIKEIVLLSNADDYDNRIYYTAILANYSLVYFWSDTTAVTWYEQSTGIVDAWEGLDATWNDNFSEYYVYLSYIGHVVGTELTNPVVVVRHKTGVWERIQVLGDHTGFHGMTSVSAYGDTIICAYEHAFTNGSGIQYNISYNDGASWSYGYWEPVAGQPLHNPDVTCRGGAGSAIVYDEEAGAFDPVWFRYRDRYAAGAWDAETAQINDLDAATAWPNTIQWLPPNPGSSYAYGAIYISWDPDPGTPYFDRSDGEAQDICECDLNHDGNCDMADWLMFGEDWGRTDCP